MRTRSDAITTEIFSILRTSSPETAGLAAGWKEDFQFNYGDLSSSISANSRLDAGRLLRSYWITTEDESPAESLQMLFFSIQTQYSILIKFITQLQLQERFGGNAPTRKELILGTYASRHGIINYSYPDWYCWPVFELGNGFASVIDAIGEIVLSCRTSTRYPAGGDLIKQLYESMIPKALRHALGEYYTPDWLAESVLRSAIKASESAAPASLTVTDPTCGSGTFLLQAIAMKRKAGSHLDTILSTVRGLDINPLAVLTAKTNYLLAVLDLLDGTSPVVIPVYNADILTLGAPVPPQHAEDFLTALQPASAVRSRIAQDRAAAGELPKADIIAGNPPWVNWEYMPAAYRRSTRHLWVDYGLLTAKGVDLSFSKEDVSVLITSIVMDRLLRDNGVLGFILRQGIFKSAQNGAGFRRFTLRDGTPVKVIKVADLSGIRVFGDATSGAAMFLARKGRETVYPVPYEIWERTAGRKTRPFAPASGLPEVMEQITIQEQWAAPASETDRSSPWITAEKDSLDTIRKVLGMNPYRARTGVFTGGANAVYWLNLQSVEGSCVTVSNITARAKRKTEQVTATLEKEFIYPLLRGGGVQKWQAHYDAYLLCPHTPETKIRPIPQAELARRAPRTLAYLTRFRADLDSRKGFAGWEKELQRQEFHAILRVGPYTFSPYKVIWRYIASRFICAVTGIVDDPYLGKKLLLPNEKIMYVGTECEAEAYYLCGILSSTPVTRCVESYMSPTSISAHVLNKLRIPRYEATDPLHAEIARICKAGHGKLDIAPYVQEIDRLAAKVYDLAP